MSVLLVIKTPNQKLADQSFSCCAEWTVLELKKYLQQQYPTNPEPEEQRLIYSGRLLRDSEILKDFLRDFESEQSHTIHLVYIHRKISFQADNEQPRNVPKVNTEGIEDDGLRWRGTGATLSANVQQPWIPNDAQLRMWGAGANQDPMAQQLLWWQQTYAQQAQYWAQYMHQVNNSNGRTGTFTPLDSSNSPPIPNASPAPVPPAEAAAGGDINPRPQEMQRRGPLVVGLAAAQDDEDDGGIRVARDWLDWIYVGSRLAILLAVMYYYSSLSRFILVTLIVAGIYLYQKTIRRRLVPGNGHPHEVNNNINDEPLLPGQADDGNDAAAAADAVGGRREADDVNRLDRSNVGSTAIPPATNPNALNVAVNLLVGFFTSLIPDVPAPEALN